MERTLSTGNRREIRGREVADRRKSSVRKCHLISRVVKMTPLMTPEIRHRGSVSREGSNTFKCTAADGE